jgi:hypothetical protein
MFDALATLLVFDLAGLSPESPLGAACISSSWTW